MAKNSFHVHLKKQLFTFYSNFIETAVKWLTPERIKLYPATICILMFVAWGISIAVGKGLTDIAGNVIGADFMHFYTAGKFYLTGRINQLYDIGAQAAFQKNLLAPVPYNGVYYFIYPPFVTALCAPFALVGYLTGLFLWWCVGLLALTLSLHFLRKELIPLHTYSTGRLFLMSFLFFPTIAWFLYGQNTALTLLLYTLIFVMLRRQNDLTAGMALGLLLYKPQLAIAIGTMLLIKCRWRVLIGGIVGASMWIAIGLVISPFMMKEYLRLIPWLLRFQRQHDIVPTWGNSSFYGFAALLLDGFWRRGADSLALLLTIGGIVVIVLLWRRTCWKPAIKDWDMRLAATFTLGLLISPHLYLYDLMLLLLPLVIVWSYYPHGTRDRSLDGGPLLVWTALLYVVCFIGSYISLAQIWLGAFIGLPKVALQLSVPIIVGWSIMVIRRA